MTYIRPLFVVAAWLIFMTEAPGPPVGVSMTSRRVPQRAFEDNRYCAPNGTWIGPATDGPANLPEHCMNTALANTPSPGKVTVVPAGSNLNTVMAAANCGDTIQLQAGATFNAPSAWPAKPCDDRNWITVETSAIGSLPPAGVRLTPCYAGLASLRGRPAYPCPAPQNAMAKVNITGTSTRAPYWLYMPNPFTFENNANHYRFIGLEIGRPEGVGSVQGALIEFAGTSGVNKIIFDRIWLHGGDDRTPNNETAHGIDLASATYVAVIDSSITDIWCLAGVGECNQANNGGGSFDRPGQGFWGGYKVVNNYIEAAGENWFFGGDQASSTVTDVEIRRNYFEKPLIWNPYHPSYDGGGSLGGQNGRIVVENLGENKNVQRMLWEGNLSEHSWGGFSQSGTGFSIFPANQIGGSSPHWSCLAPHASGVDITHRYNHVSYTGMAFNLAQVAEDSSAPGAYCPPFAFHRISEHDDLYAHAQWSYCGPTHSAVNDCSGYFIEFLDGSGGAPHQIHDVQLNHITIGLDQEPGSSWLALGAKQASGNGMYNWVIKNNIWPSGQYGVTGGCDIAPGGRATSNAVIAGCFDKRSVFANNLIPWGTKQGAWTNAGVNGGAQVLTADQNSVQYVNLAGEDYHLAAGSPGKRKADDGKDIGADIDLVNRYTCGVTTGDARGCP